MADRIAILAQEEKKATPKPEEPPPEPESNVNFFEEYYPRSEVEKDWNGGTVLRRLTYSDGFVLTVVFSRGPSIDMRVNEGWIRDLTEYRPYDMDNGKFLTGLILTAPDGSMETFESRDLVRAMQLTLKRELLSGDYQRRWRERKGVRSDR